MVGSNPCLEMLDIDHNWQLIKEKSANRWLWPPSLFIEVVLHFEDFRSGATNIVAIPITYEYV
jgi:hypothetical protein